MKPLATHPLSLVARCFDPILQPFRLGTCVVVLTGLVVPVAYGGVAHASEYAIYAPLMFRDSQVSSTPVPIVPTATPVDLPDSYPPQADLRHGTQVVASGIGTLCWNGSCRDYDDIPTHQQPLVVTGETESTLEFRQHNAPRWVEYSIWEVKPERDEIDWKEFGWRWWAIRHKPLSTLQGTASQIQELKLQLQPGLFVMEVNAEWADEIEFGDVQYGFLIESR